VAAGVQRPDPQDERAPESRADEDRHADPAAGQHEGGGRVADRQDGEADGEGVLGDADRGPGAAERGSMDREPEARLGAVGDERGGAGEGGAADPRLDGEPAEQPHAEESCGGWADEGVERVPDRVHVADLVHEELDQEEQGGRRDEEPVAEPRELGRQCGNPAQARGEADRRHGGVEVQPGGEGDPEELSERDEPPAHGSADGAAPHAAAGAGNNTFTAIANEGSAAAREAASAERA